MEQLEVKLKEAFIDEVRAKAEHLRAQAKLWLSQAALNQLELEKRKGPQTLSE